MERPSKSFGKTNRSGSWDYPHGVAPLIDPITSYQAMMVLTLVFYVILNGTIGLFGSVANVIIIIICFTQGFSDSVNISFCALAMCDLGALLTLMWKSICSNPLFQFSEISFDSVQFQYLTAGWPHAFFVSTASWVIAFITFERCVCVALPLKARNIITPTRTFISIVCITTITLASVLPIFCSVYIVSSFHTQRNKTLYGLVNAKNGVFLKSLSFSLSVAEQLSAFIISTIFTVNLVYHLILQTHWRLQVTGGHLVAMSARDKRVMRMVTSITGIFIVCYLPNTVNIIMLIHFSPAYSMTGHFTNTYHSAWAIINMLTAINSSVNILVYYKMSSKFRASFDKMFGAVSYRKQ